jgi:hypothetical protein
MGQIPDFPGISPQIPSFLQIFGKNPGFSQSFPAIVPSYSCDAGGVLYGTELGSVTLKIIGFFCFPIKHSTHTLGWISYFDPANVLF